MRTQYRSARGRTDEYKSGFTSDDTLTVNGVTGQDCVNACRRQSRAGIELEKHSTVAAATVLL